MNVGNAVLCLVVALWATAARPQSSVDERIARVERGVLPRVVLQGQLERRFSIAERMTYHGVPGMSMAVIEDGNITWARAYGVGNRDDKYAVTTSSLFQAASLSKTVSALGAVLIAQQGRVQLDDDVRQSLRSWKPAERVTLRQLLSHSAGLTVSGFSGYEPGAPLPSTTEILNGQSPANNEAVRVTRPPGTEVRYSGGGYVAVQQLMTDVTGQPFDRYMRDAVFVPLGMDHSWFEQPLSPEHARVAASGHSRDGSLLRGKFMVHPELGAAGLWTTPSDLAQVVIALQDALAGRAPQFLKPEMAREILTANISNAGLGVFLTGPNGPSRRFTHSGRNAGFDALLVGYKNGRQAAVVMINRNNNEGFISEVLESIAREYKWPDFLEDRPQREYVAVPSSVQAAYAGSYEAAGQPRLVVVHEDDKVFARSGEDAWFRMYPASPTEFFVTENATRWTFVRGADGAVSEVLARSENAEVRRRRIR
jgi:CubicO group peptidase (beta-lactamase class C family)